MKWTYHGVKEKSVQCACKHLTLYSHWNVLYIISTVAFCVWVYECERGVRAWENVCVLRWQEDERRQTQQLHHDCNIWTIYDLFMRLICYWARDVFANTYGWGDCMIDSRVETK